MGVHAVFRLQENIPASNGDRRVCAQFTAIFHIANLVRLLTCHSNFMQQNVVLRFRIWNVRENSWRITTDGHTLDSIHHVPI